MSLCLAALATPAIAQNTGLIRLTDRDDLFGYEAIGRLEVGKSGYCTGVLISTDLVLTAAHCVMDRSGKRYGTELQFRAGLRDGVAVAERAALRTVVHPSYDPADPAAQRVLYDAALVQLDAPIPSATAAPFLVSEPSGKGSEISVVSYARGRDEALSRQAVCGLLWRYKGLLSFDCDVTFGASGAPVFELTGRRARIVSLISSGFREGGRSISYGMELPALVGRLKRQLASGEGVHPNKPILDARRIRVGDSTGTGAKFVRP
nr:serine protease [Pseudoruegeria sp. HB172150]